MRRRYIYPAVCHSILSFGRQKKSRPFDRQHSLDCTTTAAMAKNKGKRSSEMGVALPDGGVSVDNSNSSTDNAPKLEENAFAGLRQKIEQRLKDENAAKRTPKNKPKDPPADSKKKEKTVPKPTPKQESNKNKGRKRDRNGDVIAQEGKGPGEDKQSKSGGAGDDSLREEILALGGTQEDFDLLAGIDSESEVEDTSKKSSKESDDDALRKELSNMLSAAGQVAPGDVKESEESEESAEDDNAEDDEDNEVSYSKEDIEDIEEETPPPPVKPAKEPSKKEKKKAAEEPETILPKEYSKLVSISHFSLYD